MASDRESDLAFEHEVLRIARLAYPDSAGGAEMVGGRERDAVLIGREVVVAIEATRSRRVEKVVKDLSKLQSLTDTLAKRYPERAIKGFIVTADEPTADQRRKVSQSGNKFVSIVSFAQFRGRIFDALSYLAARDDYAFGSARDLRTNAVRVMSAYIPMGLREVLVEGNTWTIEQISAGIADGALVVITGDFGIGKSMTLREVYKNLSVQHRCDSAARVPIHLNLRDHRGQDDPAEALHRHAKRIGYGAPDDLVRAWRSDQTVLILDGFDEITYPGWTGRVNSLAEVRRANVKLLRSFIAESTDRTGVLLAGRSHFFDSFNEMEETLGLGPRQWAHLESSDFSDEQVRDFLAANKLAVKVPEWLPTRPLLLGYLALNGFLDEGEDEDSPSDISGSGQVGRAAGWDLLLQHTAQREADMEDRLPASMIRGIIERTATLARKSTSGRGPLRFDELTAAFRAICGHEPDEGTRVILDRLPGLGVAKTRDLDSGDQTREFIDADFVDAARAGDIARFVNAPSVSAITEQEANSWIALLDDVGIEVVWHQIDLAGRTGQDVAKSVDRARKMYPEQGIVADLFRVLAWSGESLDEGPEFSMRDHVFPSLHLSPKGNLGRGRIEESIVERLVVEGIGPPGSIPTFWRTQFVDIEGVAGLAELPKGKFEDCEFDRFLDDASSTAGILGLNLTDEAKVALVILKKIYKQRGSGRKESALSRGGLTEQQRGLVNKTLTRLRREGLVTKSRGGGSTVVWHPVPSARQRVNSILASPVSSSDSVIAGD